MIKQNFVEIKFAIILFLILFFSIGLFLMWKYRKSSAIKTKAIISVIVAVTVVGIGFGFNMPFKQQLDQIQQLIINQDFILAKQMLDEEISINDSYENVYLVYSDFYISQLQYDNSIDILEKGLKSVSDKNGLNSKINEIKTKYDAEINHKIENFSYSSDSANWVEGEVGMKKDNFKNTAVRNIDGYELALELAKNELTVSYNRCSVAYDESEKIWRIEFWTENRLGGNQSVYLNSNGTTKICIWEE